MESNGSAFVRYGTPLIIKSIEEKDTIHITHKPLVDSETVNYTVSTNDVDREEHIIVTGNYEKCYYHTSPKTLLFTDKTDTILFQVENTKGNCLRQVIQVFSPAGFLVGTVKQSFSCCSRVSKIFGGNQQELFRLRYYTEFPRSTAQIKNRINNTVVANITQLSTANDGNTTFKLSYNKKLPVLQKVLTLVATVTSSIQEQRYQHQWEQRRTDIIISLAVVLFFLSLPFILIGVVVILVFCPCIIPEKYYNIK